MIMLCCEQDLYFREELLIIIPTAQSPAIASPTPYRLLHLQLRQNKTNSVPSSFTLATTFSTLYQICFSLFSTKANLLCRYADAVHSAPTASTPAT